ncbi:hypothetical protein [Candidatus Oscillochloris fontis]|uniref:hypothetical protein n=1 Tax=Candidatus Oscillochloris fontis TaxID=2496868 RepID=UPI00101CBBC7|nr:hypothetical protein [Candidatus Oscillochloris fontis]
MASTSHAEVEPGEILSAAGAERFRRLLRSGTLLRCADRWMAIARPVDAAEMEIEIYCCRDDSSDCWAAEVYYYDLERALVALVEYEMTGNMPEGE